MSQVRDKEPPRPGQCELTLRGRARAPLSFLCLWSWGVLLPLPSSPTWFSSFASVQCHILGLGQTGGEKQSWFSTRLPSTVPSVVLCAGKVASLFRTSPWPAHAPQLVCCAACLPDAAPLSAPAFSLVFPMLKMVLTEMPYHSEEEEEQMAQILQILTVHAQLRASPDAPPERTDEVDRELCYPWFQGVGRQGLLYFFRFWCLIIAAVHRRQQALM